MNPQLLRPDLITCSEMMVFFSPLSEDLWL